MKIQQLIFNEVDLVPSLPRTTALKHKMASDGSEVNSDFLPSSPVDEHNFPTVFNHLTSPRNHASESSEKSDNSLSDNDENIPREYELSEQYGRTPPRSRGFTKPSKERTKNSRRKKEKSASASPSFNSWRRRQSASATSSQRAFNRSIKEEETTVILINGYEDAGFKPRNRSLTESSLSRKPSQRKYQCIRYRESSLNAVNSVNFKEDETAVCPLERVRFYDTMNVLINLGQGGNSEGKENVEEMENYEVEELREALWLELQAWHNSTTMLDQDEWLMNERKKINSILDDIIYFHLDKTKQVNFDVQFSDTESEFESEDEEGCCYLHPYCSLVEHPNENITNDLTYYEDPKLSTSSDVSTTTISTDEETYKLSDFAQNIKKAVKKVSSVLNKLYSVEQLYPSCGALSKDFEKYNSEEFKTSYDTLVLWLNQVKGLYHKLHVMARLVHVDFEDEKVWGDWIHLGVGML